MSIEIFSEIKKDIIEFFEESLAGHGNKRVGGIYGNIFASIEPQTQEMLAEKLNISNSTVSRALNSLENRFRLIKSKRLPGTKKAEYLVTESTFDKLLTIGVVELFQQYQMYNNRLVSLKNRYLAQLQSMEKSEESKFYIDLLNVLEASISFHVEKIGELVTVLQTRTA